MKQVHTLIDYDNAKRSAERTASDVAINLSILISALASRISALIPDSEELWCRLYGGWITLDRQTTFQGSWMLGEVPKLRGRHGPLRAKLTIATELASRRDLTLVGTYRDGGQKMVDGMISTDLMSLAADAESSLVLVSDDDDFVPSTIAGASQRSAKNPIFVLRRQKKPGSAPNDDLLGACNVTVAEY